MKAYNYLFTFTARLNVLADDQDEAADKLYAALEAAGITEPEVGDVDQSLNQKQHDDA